MSEDSKASFLRQSGWMAIATAVGGAASFAAHIFAKDMPKDEYGGFTAMLQLLNLIEDTRTSTAQKSTTNS